MAATINKVSFHDHHPPAADFYREVIEGLQRQPKAIPPKFFYDQEGSRLFDAICELPEYYPTRTERRILQDNAEAIAQLVGPDCMLIEPGSGNCDKVRLLLDDIKPQAYVPMDISGEHLLNAAEKLAGEYPWLNVHAACVDFTQPLDLSFCATDSNYVAFFPGSSIGNFDPSKAQLFLKHVAETVGPGGGLLIGVDLKKDPAVLTAAYNDKQGVTAAFNLNLLSRINRELGADFEFDEFTHQALYNESQGRIEMHLVSKTDQRVTVDGQRFVFATGESIHTENSYKYTIDEFQRLGSAAGFMPVYVWTDPDQLFSVHYLTVPLD